MEGQIQEWKEEIRQITNQFEVTFGGLDSKELNWKPNADTWSIAQIMDHIITINETYGPILEKARKGTLKLPFYSKLGIINTFFANVILKGVSPSTKRKTKTFPIWEPSQSDLDVDILDKFKAHQAKLISMIQNSTELIRSGAIIHSPANKNVVYSIEMAFEIMITHEMRHFNQAKEVLDLMRITN